MTDKRITIQDLLNDEAESCIVQEHKAYSAQTVSPSESSNGVNSVAYQTESARVSSSNTPLGSMPGRYSFANSGAAALPSNTRLLSSTSNSPNTLTSHESPMLPIHLTAYSTQPPQLPNFHIKSEPHAGIRAFTQLPSLGRSPTLPMVGSQSATQPLIPPMRTPPKSAPHHVSKPLHSMLPHHQHQLGVALQENDRFIGNGVTTMSETSGNSGSNTAHDTTKSPSPLSGSPNSQGKNLHYKINKPQGRPIIQSIIGKFTLYANIQDLILDITRFDRIRLRDVFNESLGPFELIRYSKDDMQLHHHNQTVNTDSAATDTSTQNHSNSSIQKNLIINEAQVYDKLTQEFQCQYLKFIKIIRDKKGKLIRLESVIIPNTNDITIDFIKKKICYPRYKSNMKIYLIKCDSSEEFQNKFIYIHDTQKLEDGKNLVNIEGLDKETEQFKNLTIWCRNE